MLKTHSKNKPKCSCCHEEKMEEKSICEKQLLLIENKKLLWYADHPYNGGVRNLFENGHFVWACDDCIVSGKALAANPEKQFYSDHPPYLAYFDQWKKCEKCGDEFVFSKEKQQHWYEELGFRLKSSPKYCAKCQNEIKNKKMLNTELSDLIKNLDKNNTEQLARISEIYFEMSKTEKSKEYSTLAKKTLERKIENNER